MMKSSLWAQVEGSPNLILSLNCICSLNIKNTFEIIEEYLDEIVDVQFPSAEKQACFYDTVAIKTEALQPVYLLLWQKARVFLCRKWAWVNDHTKGWPECSNQLSYKQQGLNLFS